MRFPLRWRALRETLLPLGPVSGDGLRPTDLSRKLARHRDLPASGRRQTLPHGFPYQHGTLTPAAQDANMFAPELATMRTVDVPQFCSWSVCRIKNWFRAFTTSGSGVMCP